MDIMVSVVMATYNGEKFVKKQINSILAQTLSDFELIIIDDGSTDTTCEIINQINDERISLFVNEKNAGCAKAFELGLSRVRGQYIALVDQDDIWYEKKLEKLVSNIKEADLIYSDCEVIDADGLVLHNSYKQLNKIIGLDSRNKDIIVICGLNSFILGCSILFRTTLLKHVLPIIDCSWNHDKWIVMIASIVGEIKFLDECTFQYRIHDTNLSFIKNKESFVNRIINIRKKKSKPLIFNQCALNFIHNKMTEYNSSPSGFECINYYASTKFKFFLKFRPYMNMRDGIFEKWKKIFLWFIRPNC